MSLEIFRGMRLTNIGRNMLAEAVATGTPLHIVEIIVGDAFMPGGVTRDTITEVVNPVHTRPISSRVFRNIGVVILRMTLSSGEIPTGFFIREFGVMARLGDGPLRLYAYDNAGNNAPPMPASGGSELVTQVFRLTTQIDNAANVVVEVVGGISLENVIDEIVTVDNQQLLTPTNTNPNGAMIVVVEGIIVFGWTVDGSGNVLLPAPLPADHVVHLIETVGS